MDDGFNEFLHVPARLTIVVLLAPTSWTEFGFLRDAVPTSDSALSKHLSSLAAKGYVEVRKVTQAGGCGTLIRLTPEGRQEFRRHAVALERIAATAHSLHTGELDGCPLRTRVTTTRDGDDEPCA